MKLFIIISSLFISQITYAAREVVVLVPGFFNSFAPEYFSNDIQKAFTQQGFTVYVATGLDPVGTIEKNGELLMKNLRQIEACEKTKVEFNIVAHSAGGLYALYAAHSQEFTIKNLLTVSTPYAGVEFIENWLQNSTAFNLIASLAHLEGLKQLSPRQVVPFVQSVRVSPDLKIVAFGGTQKINVDILNARYLSLPFHVTSAAITGASDGIVGFDSAMAVGAILNTNNQRAAQIAQPNYKINLDHWEQVLDGRSFVILGTRNPSYIRSEQKRFYTGLAGYLKTIL